MVDFYPMTESTETVITARADKIKLTERSFADALRRLLDHEPARRKGERTRQALVWATVSLMDMRGYHDLRITDICEAAEVSSAAFYQYFENKAEITAHGLNLFSEVVFSCLAELPTQEDNRTALFEANHTWIVIARRNTGLMRALLQVGLEIETVAETFERLNARYCETAAHALSKRTGKTLDEARLLTAALSSMTDDFTRRILSDRNTILTTAVDRNFSSDRQLAEFLTDIWYKVFYL